DTQNTAASRTHLRHSGDVVAHAAHLWNSSHVASNSARRSSTQRRACFRTLLGAFPASKSPVEMRILAAKSGAFNVHVRRILVLKEHQEPEAAKPRDFRHPRSQSLARI